MTGALSKGGAAGRQHRFTWWPQCSDGPGHGRARRGANGLPAGARCHRCQKSGRRKVQTCLVDMFARRVVDMYNAQ